jgi:hypothetical protein
LLQDFLKNGDFDFFVHGLFKTFFVKNGIFFPETASAIIGQLVKNTQFKHSCTRFGAV